MPIDRAAIATQQYLQILKERLHIELDWRGELICDLSQINTFTLHRLKSDLRSTLIGASGENARIDTRDFGRRKVQTLGFGLAGNFDQFVKMGYLCGERVVLWDYICGRALENIDGNPDLVQHIASTALDLVALEPIVAQGALIILQHPAEWNPETQQALIHLARSGKYSAVNQGLATALSVVDEFFAHPYTLFPGEPIEWPAHPEGLASHGYFSPDHFALQKAVASLLGDSTLPYIENLSAADFYNAVFTDTPESSFHVELRRWLRPDSQSKSPQEELHENSHSRLKLRQAVENYRSKLMAKLLARSGAQLGFVVAGATLLNRVTMANASSDVAIALGGLGGALCRLLQAALEREEGGLLVQAFHRAKMAYDHPS